MLWERAEARVLTQDPKRGELECNTGSLPIQPPDVGGKKFFFVLFCKGKDDAGSDKRRCVRK